MRQKKGGRKLRNVYRSSYSRQGIVTLWRFSRLGRSLWTTEPPSRPWPTFVWIWCGETLAAIGPGARRAALGNGVTVARRQSRRSLPLSKCLS